MQNKKKRKFINQQMFYLPIMHFLQDRKLVFKFQCRFKYLNPIINNCLGQKPHNKGDHNMALVFFNMNKCVLHLNKDNHYTLKKIRKKLISNVENNPLKNLLLRILMNTEFPQNKKIIFH